MAKISAPRTVIVGVDTHKDVHVAVEEHAPHMLAIRGAKTEVASTLLVIAGDNPERLKSEASFAALCGVSPMPASSGNTQRHRLNRGGDRQGNRALWWSRAGVAGGVLRSKLPAAP